MGFSKVVTSWTSTRTLAIPWPTTTAPPRRLRSSAKAGVSTAPNRFGVPVEKLIHGFPADFSLKPIHWIESETWGFRGDGAGWSRFPLFGRVKMIKSVVSMEMILPTVDGGLP